MTPLRLLTATVAVAALMLTMEFALSPEASARNAPGNSCAVGLPLEYDGNIQTSRFNYRITRSSLPASTTRGQNQYIARIRDGMRTWNEGRTDCHYPKFDIFRTAFVGDSGSSAANHDDGINTVDFGRDTDCRRSRRGSLIIACTVVEPSGDNFRGRVVNEEADIRFLRRDGLGWSRRAVRPRCPEANRCYDLWGSTAHEVGHVVGIDDHFGSEHQYQTMYHLLEEASNAWPTRDRTLGRMDYVGYKNIYEGLAPLE
jgi:hypothetical protein